MGRSRRSTEGREEGKKERGEDVNLGGQQQLMSSLDRIQSPHREARLTLDVGLVCVFQVSRGSHMTLYDNFPTWA